MEIRGPLFTSWGSLLTGRDFRRLLIAVRDWATVSAMPPRIWNEVSQKVVVFEEGGNLRLRRW